MLNKAPTVFLLVCLTTLFVFPPDVAAAVADSNSDHQTQLTELVTLQHSRNDAESFAPAQLQEQATTAGAGCEAIQESIDIGLRDDALREAVAGSLAEIEELAALGQGAPCRELMEFVYSSDPAEVTRNVDAVVAELERNLVEFEVAAAKLPRAERRSSLQRQIAARSAIERFERYNPDQPYLASDFEIDEVQSYLRANDIELDRQLVVSASKFWYKGQSLDERSREPITLGTLAVLAAAGALKSFLIYYIDHKLHGAEFTCNGIAKAVITGAVLGAVGGALSVSVFVAETVLTVADLSEFCGVLSGTVASVFDLNPTLVQASACGVGSIALGWINEILEDAIWASSPTVRALAAGICSAVDSKELRRGGLSSMRSWATNEMVPAIMSEFGLHFVTIQHALDSDLNGAGHSPEEVPFVQGGLDLIIPGTGRDQPLFVTTDTADVSMRVQANQAGNYTVRLKVFRAGSDHGTVLSRSFTAASPYQDATLTGSVNMGTVFSQAGSVDGPHAFRIEVQNTSGGWTEWVQDDDQNVAEWDVEIRQNRKPSISLDCATLLGLTKCDLFILDPDGVRPQSAYLRVNGSDENLTSLLPASGVDWAEGYTLIRNYSWTQGVYSVRARVSDGQFTMYSGEVRDLRVATLPYPVFPAVALTSVGEQHRYSVRFEDSIGGIGGKTVYLGTDHDGFFLDTSGEPTFSVQTGSTGWAYFDYTPMETGQHTLTITIDQYELSQTSNQVAPGCVPPGRPALDSPFNGEDNVPTTATLEWRNRDDVSTYDVYLDDHYPPTNLEASVPYNGSVSHQTVTAAGLNPGTLYYWKVVGHGECDPTQTTDSWVWSFFTEGAPDAPTLTRPLNGATDIATSVVLDWENVTSPGGTLYFLYFDTSNPPVFAEDLGTRTEKLVESLDPDTTYYWKVRSVLADNPSLWSDSAVWSFTTGSTTGGSVTLKAVQDAGLRGGSYGNTNYGGSGGGWTAFFALGNDDNWFSTVGEAPLKGAVQFDLSSIPAGVEISSATLRLHWHGSVGNQTVPLGLTFSPFTASWNEYSTTWNNRPSVNAAHAMTGVFPLSGFNPLDNNLTDLAQKWHSGSVANHGILISLPAWENDYPHAKYFGQREEYPDESAAPELTVVFSSPCTAPPPPQLTLPANGATEIDSSVTLEWGDVSGISGYKVYFGASATPPEIALAATSSFTVSDLSASTTYHWKIEAIADCDPSVTSSSATWSFTTTDCMAPQEPVLISPTFGSTGLGHNVSLSWSPVQGAGSYRVFAGTDDPPTTELGSTAGTSMTITTLPSKTYHWYVRAEAACDLALWTDSQQYAFVTATAPSANAGSNRTIEVGQSTGLGGSPTGTGGTPPYSYQWTVTTDETYSLSSATSPNPEFIGITSGNFYCSVIVTDSLGFSSLPSQMNISVIDTPIFIDGFESGDTLQWTGAVP